MEHRIHSAPVLVVGHRGMLGQTLLRRLNSVQPASPAAVGVDRAECDITDARQVARTLDELRPAAVVNCAAYTAVDQAETEREAAWRLNAEAVEILGRAARERGLHFITISTDYVFTGQGEAPWPEDAPAEAFGPESVYGQSKLEGERRLAAVGGDWCIARTQWLYGAGGKNFIDTIAALAPQKEELSVVNDQVGAPTWAADLAAGLCILLRQRATGVYHLVNSGYDSWYEVARHIVRRLRLATRVTPCTSDQYPRPARRPKNSRLAQDKYARLAGAPMRPWREALDDYLASRITMG